MIAKTIVALPLDALLFSTEGDCSPLGVTFHAFFKCLIKMAWILPKGL